MSTAYKMYGYVNSLFPYNISDAWLQNIISYCTKCRDTKNLNMDTITLPYIVQDPY